MYISQNYFIYQFIFQSSIQYLYQILLIIYQQNSSICGEKKMQRKSSINGKNEQRQKPQFVSYTKYLKDRKNKQLFQIQKIKCIKNQYDSNKDQNSNVMQSISNYIYKMRCKCNDKNNCNCKINQNARKKEIKYNDMNQNKITPTDNKFIPNFKNNQELFNNNQNKDEKKVIINGKDKVDSDINNSRNIHDKLKNNYKRRDNIQSFNIKNNKQNIDTISQQFQIQRTKYNNKSRQTNMSNEFDKYNQKEKHKNKTIQDYLNDQRQNQSMLQSRHKQKTQIFPVINKTNQQNSDLCNVEQDHNGFLQKQKNRQKELEHCIDQKASIVNGKLVYIQQQKPQLNDADELIYLLNKNQIKLKDYIYGNKQEIIKYIEENYQKKKNEQVLSYIAKNIKKQDIVKTKCTDWYNQNKLSLFTQD